MVKNSKLVIFFPFYEHKQCDLELCPSSTFEKKNDMYFEGKNHHHNLLMKKSLREKLQLVIILSIWVSTCDKSDLSKSPRKSETISWKLQAEHVTFPWFKPREKLFMLMSSYQEG